MSDKPMVMIFPRGELTPKDKERLTKAGVVAVEADNPSAVVELQPSAHLSTDLFTGDMIVRAAIKSMVSINSMQPAYEFVKAINLSLHPTKSELP